MTFPLSLEKLGEILGAKVAPEHLAANLPFIEAALARHGILSTVCEIAAIATVAVETGNFTPRKELGSEEYFERHYEARLDLGNTHPGDGCRFCGRGFVQITGRTNYKNYGHAIGADLVTHPDLALDPEHAADILARFFKDHGIDKAAAAGEWALVRRKVNGGLNGYGEFLRIVNALELATNS